MPAASLRDLDTTSQSWLVLLKTQGVTGYRCDRSGTNVPRSSIELLSETRQVKTNKVINILLRGSWEFSIILLKDRDFGERLVLLVVKLTRPCSAFKLDENDH